MGSSAKKKKEKKADFQKAKLKVGKARPKNTNATDTSFQAKSIVLKQQSLSEGSRDGTALLDHNLSLLSSKTDIQRRDALIYLTTIMAASPNDLPRPASQVLEKAQPLMIDGSSSVRSQLLKLLRVLPANQLGDLSRTLLFARNAMTHLSNDIRLDALGFFDWLMETNGEAAVSMAGGWVKTLRTFQTVLSWQDATQNAPAANGNWSAVKGKSNLGSNKLLVHQLNSLSRLLTVGLKRAPVDLQAQAKRAAELFPLWQTDAHMVPKKSNPYGYLNLFGAPRDVESEVYDDAEERANVFFEVGLDQIFKMGVQEAKKEGGEPRLSRAKLRLDRSEFELELRTRDISLPSIRCGLQQAPHKMASALDALPPIKDNASLCKALNFKNGELIELEKAIEFEMAQEVYDGQALLGITNFRDFDPHHKHRNEVQRRVAESGPVAQEIFEGSRWPAADITAYQRGPLIKAFHFIVRHLSAAAMLDAQRKEGKRALRNSSHGITDSEANSPAPGKRRISERRSSSRIDNIDLGSSPAQPTAPRERLSTPDLSLVMAVEDEEIAYSPQCSSKRQRLSLRDAMRGSPGSDEKREDARSHGPTPSPLTSNRQGSFSSQTRFSPYYEPAALITPSEDARIQTGETSLPLDDEPQTGTQTQITPASQTAMVIKEEESSGSTCANFPGNSLAAQMQSTTFQLVDARVDSRRLELADELNTMIDQSVEEHVAEKSATQEKEMEERITAHVMAELIKGFSGSAA